MKKEEQPPGAATAADEPVRLDRLMVCHINRPGKPAGKVIADRVSEHLLLCSSPTPFEENEEVEVEMLLQGAGSIKVKGKVAWTLTSHSGRRVQISLAPEGEAAEKLSKFVRLQRKGMRGHALSPRNPR